MAQTITVNQSKGSRGVSSLVVHANSTGFISFTGNAPVNYAANTAGETVSSLYIAEMYWNTSNANYYWTIRRGSTIVWTCYGQNGYINFADSGLRLETPTEAQANVTFQQYGNVELIMKLHKSGGA
jgi:hypothetical protein